MSASTSALAVATLAVAIGLAGGGQIKFEFLPDVEEADNVSARLTMPLGTPVDVTTAATARLEASLEEVRREIEAKRGPGQPPVIRHILSSIGDQPTLSQSQGPMGGQSLVSGAHLAEIDVELARAEDGLKRWSRSPNPPNLIVETSARKADPFFLGKLW